MPINPEISLAVRPPQIPDPLESVGRLLSLRDLLQRGKMNEFAMRQQQAEADEYNQFRQGLSTGKTPEELTAISPKQGIAYRKFLSDQEKAELERQKQQLEIGAQRVQRLGSLAQSVLGADPAMRPNLYAQAIQAAVREGLIPKEKLGSIPQNYDQQTEAMLQQEAQAAMSAEEQIRAKQKEIDQRLSESQTKETRRHNRAMEDRPTEAELAWRAARGDKQAFEALKQLKRTTPVPGRDVPLPPDVEDQRKRMNASRAQVQGLSPMQFNRVQVLASQFDGNPVIKNFNETANKFSTVKGVIDRGVGGPGDLAIVFEFMKGLDPTSVVRESEYDTASKSGNIFRGIWAKFNGYLKPEGGFLPPEVKRSFLSILEQKLQTSSKQVKGIYEDFGRRIDKITGHTGTGLEYLTDYTEIMPQEEQPPTAASTVRIRDPKTGRTGTYQGTAEEAEAEGYEVIK